MYVCIDLEFYDGEEILHLGLSFLHLVDRMTRRKGEVPYAHALCLTISISCTSSSDNLYRCLTSIVGLRGSADDEQKKKTGEDGPKHGRSIRVGARADCCCCFRQFDNKIVDVDDGSGSSGRGEVLLVAMST